MARRKCNIKQNSLGKYLITEIFKQNALRERINKGESNPSRKIIRTMF